ncbi:MAG: C-glycoside deglycosidase beta subunit domain-containing protein [Candidatus Asgardarchaeia archaeon]
MVKVPSFLLKKLYSKGSLKNLDDGFQFQIKNVLADATIISPLTLSVDGKEIDPQSIIIKTDNEEMNSSEISAEKPIQFKVKTTVTIIVKGDKLGEGEHKIHIESKTKEYGPISFDIKDSVH